MTGFSATLNEWHNSCNLPDADFNAAIYKVFCSDGFFPHVCGATRTGSDARIFHDGYLHGGVEMKKTGWSLNLLLAVFMMTALFTTGAEAVLRDFGPLNFGGFPSWYRDNNG